MATHPTQRECICEWDGDDHYPQFKSYKMNCPMHRCGKMLIQDDQRDICVLLTGHEGECARMPSYSKLEIKPHMRRVETLVEDDDFREVTRGDGIIYTVPKWIADRLEEVGLG